VNDISHAFGSDLALSATGDLLVVSGDALTQQRVLRRLLTNAGDYIWHLAYGAGLGQMVGQPANAAAIENIIRSQIFRESSVAQVPAPIVTTTANTDGTVTVTIQYADAVTGAGSTLTFQVK
jgi:phage baseplate assembly protein W